MAKQVSKSKTFAVVLVFGSELGAYFICRRTDREEGKDPLTYLDVEAHRIPGWGPKERDQVIDLLIKAGLTVRYFDSEESQWMDQSRSYGLVRAPGSRDGSWGPPLSVGDFERDYLETL